LRMQTVAEGIETRQQVDFLCSLGCDLIQGYYFARPMPIDEFERNNGYNAVPEQEETVSEEVVSEETSEPAVENAETEEIIEVVEAEIVSSEEAVETEETTEESIEKEETDSED
ncbi:MAG: EAL domain-containing protein, partial [Oscillospiraceae bacterium]|nr:EAL domain-containing protein [Oscillospiraceae bacterium]